MLPVCITLQTQERLCSETKPVCMDYVVLGSHFLIGTNVTVTVMEQVGIESMVMCTHASVLFICCPSDWLR